MTTTDAHHHPPTIDHCPKHGDTEFVDVPRGHCCVEHLKDDVRASVGAYVYGAMLADPLRFAKITACETILDPVTVLAHRTARAEHTPPVPTFVDRVDVHAPAFVTELIVGVTRHPLYTDMRGPAQKSDPWTVIHRIDWRQDDEPMRRGHSGPPGVLVRPECPIRFTLFNPTGAPVEVRPVVHRHEVRL